MRGFVVGTVATAITFYIVTRLLPQDLLSYDGDLVGLLALAVVFGLVNGFIGPVVKSLSLPISMVTMGLAGFLVNGALLLLTAAVADGLSLDFRVGDFPPDITADTIVAAVIGAVVLGIVNTLVNMVVPD
ncbi:MAG: phage holin family protein [Chloroflexi bacterium]|nr:phage holin family protein [Chloroflexota bacterium]